MHFETISTTQECSSVTDSYDPQEILADRNKTGRRGRAFSWTSVRPPFLVYPSLMFFRFSNRSIVFAFLVVMDRTTISEKYFGERLKSSQIALVRFRRTDMIVALLLVGLSFALRACRVAAQIFH